jgi:DNA (cytosine-5)-methyltransferase 1
MDKYAAKTHGANFPKVPMFRGDVARFLIDPQPGVPSKRELIDGGVDLVFGGPPCQGFSQIGPRDLKDPRNLLYLEFARVLKALKPKAFIMENVPNMVAMKNGHFRDLIFSALKGAGYRNTVLVPLTASEYGVPQHRRRVFFVGTRDDLASPGDLAVHFNRYLCANRSEREITVREAISDLPRMVSLDDGPLPYPKLRLKSSSDFQRAMRLDCESPLVSKQWKNANLDGAALLHNHHTKGIEARRRRIVSAMKPGMCGDSLPPALWNGSRPNKWRRLHPDQPSYTILAQMQRDLSEWIHPKHDRWITVREAARLQSFHDGFIFLGSEVQQLKQVGNAVPPLFAYAIASAARRLLRAI